MTFHLYIFVVHTFIIPSVLVAYLQKLSIRVKFSIMKNSKLRKENTILFI
jgi:hypothetical protein